MNDLDNIAEFKTQLACVVSDLYKIWPETRAVDTSRMTQAGIKFLASADIITGRKLTETHLSSARLTERAMSVLQKPEQNANGERLGKVVVAAMTGTSEREKQVITDLLAPRLLDF